MPKKQGKKLDPKLKKEVDRIVNSKLSAAQETKFFTPSQLAVGVDFSGSLWQISAIPQGDTDSQRDGDSLRYKHISLRFGWSAGDGANFVRVVLFKWSDRTTPTSATILQIVGTANAPFSSFTWDSKKQITLIYDELFALVDEADNSIVCRKIERVVRGTPQYQAATINGTHQIWLLAISDSGATPNPQFNFVAQLTYTDS